MKTKQTTIEGMNALDKVLEWIKNLKYCFEVKSVKIIQLKQPFDWDHDKYRVTVKYK